MDAAIAEMNQDDRQIYQIPVDALNGGAFISPSFSWGKLAQLVEQRTENPCVPGSIPGLATTLFW